MLYSTFITFGYIYAMYVFIITFKYSSNQLDIAFSKYQLNTWYLRDYMGKNMFLKATITKIFKNKWKCAVSKVLSRVIPPISVESALLKFLFKISLILSMVIVHLMCLKTRLKNIFGDNHMGQYIFILARHTNIILLQKIYFYDF